MTAKNANTVVILNFETTGSSPASGDRVIEVGAILLKEGVITHHYQSLINPECRISSFVERLSGITNVMLAKAPPSSTVFKELDTFIGDHNIVSHDAVFHQTFFKFEMRQVGSMGNNSFACSLLIARRLYQNTLDHNLAALAQHLKLPTEDNDHNTLADARITARLWLKFIETLKTVHHLDQISFPFMRKLSRMPESATAAFLHKQTRASWFCCKTR